jgi:NAD-dependent deacetylase
MSDVIRKAAALIHSSVYPCVLSGAGVSRESGIPTFRDSEGLWTRYDPRKLVSVAGFYENPQLVWEFFEMYRPLVAGAQPNAGHQAIARLEAQFFPNLPVITQNVDDLHERAGSQNVRHLHGLVSQNRCSRYCRGVPLIVEDQLINWSREEKPPRCPYCNAYVRPNVIFFGEFLHSQPVRRAQQAVDQADLMIIIGTSGVVAPASELPQQAKQS